jgi:hypothetical protein
MPKSSSAQHTAGFPPPRRRPRETRQPVHETRTNAYGTAAGHTRPCECERAPDLPHGHNSDPRRHVRPRVHPSGETRLCRHRDPASTQPLPGWPASGSPPPAAFARCPALVVVRSGRPPRAPSAQVGLAGWESREPELMPPSAARNGPERLPGMDPLTGAGHGRRRHHRAVGPMDGHRPRPQTCDHHHRHRHRHRRHQRTDAARARRSR